MIGLMGTSMHLKIFQREDYLNHLIPVVIHLFIDAR